MRRLVDALVLTIDLLFVGLLVYNSLINLMATQFKPVAINYRPYLQAGQYIALAAGYCAMAFVGKYA